MLRKNDMSKVRALAGAPTSSVGESTSARVNGIGIVPRITQQGVYVHPEKEVPYRQSQGKSKENDQCGRIQEVDRCPETNSQSQEATKERKTELAHNFTLTIVRR